MNHDSDPVRRLHARQPDISAMRKHLPDMGESLHNAAIDLARDCTTERCDQMLARLKGAETSLMHLRRKLMQEGGSE
jgi:hypothetical protein